MKLIESNVEYIPQAEGLEGIYRQIEIAGRTAYKSEDKITEGSAKKFVDMLIRNKHYAALEHGTVYLIECCSKDQRLPSVFERLPYTKINAVKDSEDKNSTIQYMITTNMRVYQEYCMKDSSMNAVMQNNCEYQYFVNPTEHHEKRYTFKFTCSRAIAQELTRHRVFSFLMESQRYVNYSKDRFGKDITFIKPEWLNFNITDIPENMELNFLAKQYDTNDTSQCFVESLVHSKHTYMSLLRRGCSPQIARDVLPNATKTELVMTGFASDWRNLLDIRLFEKTGKVHPEMQELMGKLTSAMSDAGVWKDVMKYPSKFE